MHRRLVVGHLAAPLTVSQAQGPAKTFTNVTVIPMDEARALRDQTVVMRDDRIIALGPAVQTPVAAGQHA